MGRTLILRPISDITVNHDGRNGNSNVNSNRFALINEVTPDGATSYICDNWSATSNGGTSNKISTFNINYVESEGNKPAGKIRLNNINYITTYTSFSQQSASSISDSIQCAISIDNNEYSYSTTYTRTQSSNTFYTYNHNLNSISSSQLGKIYNSIDDLNIKLMVITNLSAQYNN